MNAHVSQPLRGARLQADTREYKVYLTYNAGSRIGEKMSKVQDRALPNKLGGQYFLVCLADWLTKELCAEIWTLQLGGRDFKISSP
jgi:hypothetical protein